MPPRIISVLCLIQVMALLGCLLAVSWFLKTHEKLHGVWVLNTDWGLEMVNLRRWSSVLLMVPVGIAILCSWLARVDRDIAVLGPDGVLLAIISTLAIAWYSFVVFGRVIMGPPQLSAF